MHAPIAQQTAGRLAIVATHPVQYNAPWFRMLAQNADLEVKVFYTWTDGSSAIKDPGFGRQITWDVPLTEGYDFQLVPPSSEVVSRLFRNMDSPGLIDAVNEFQPTAVLVVGWNFRSHLRALRYFHGRVPVLFRGDSTLLDKRPGPKALLRSILLRWVLSSVDYALSVGTNNAAYFRHHGLTHNQIVDVPHAIDNARFQGIGADYDTQAASLRQELGFSDSNTVLLFAGKFEHKKRPDRLVELFKDARADRPDLRLLMVGNGVMEEQLKQMASVCAAIQFLPFQNQNQIPVIYRVGDITVLPSEYNETWGLALNESMASGRTVMATAKCGATVDLIKPGITGFIFPDTNIHTSLQTHMLRDLPNREELLEMGAVCQTFISTNWTYDVVVSAIQKLLIRLSKDPQP